MQLFAITSAFQFVVGERFDDDGSSWGSRFLNVIKQPTVECDEAEEVKESTTGNSDDDNANSKLAVAQMKSRDCEYLDTIEELHPSRSQVKMQPRIKSSSYLNLPH